MLRRDFEEKFIKNKSLNTVSKEEVALLLGEEVALMVGYDQNNPHHCYNLWEHSIATMQYIECSENIFLRVAALFHDIGKPYVAKKKNGRTVFYGHAKKSAEICKSLLCELGYTGDEVREIIFYIEHHDDFISWVLPQEEYDHKNKYLVEITALNLQKHINKVSLQEQLMLNKNHWEMLLELCAADASAQAVEVWQGGKLVDTRAHKLAKVEAMKAVLHIVTV